MYRPMPVLETAGAALHYTREGQGPPVLLVQGVGVVGEGWRPQIDGLADRFTVLAFDNRGFGGSTIRDGALSIESMAGDAIALVDALGFERFHVAGHSMGGVIAQAIALRATARVRSLAFLCTFAHGRDGAAAVDADADHVAPDAYRHARDATKRVPRAHHAGPLSSADGPRRARPQAAAPLRVRPRQPAAHRDETAEGHGRVRRGPAARGIVGNPHDRGGSHRGPRVAAQARPGACRRDTRRQVRRARRRGPRRHHPPRGTRSTRCSPMHFAGADARQASATPRRA